MNVSLTPELEKYIADKVGSGLYGTASEVVREALRLLKATEVAQQQRFANLQQEIEQGWQQRDSGPAVPADTVLADLRQRTEAQRASSQRSKPA